MPPLYDRYRRGQPGELSRPQAWWDVYARDPEWTRQGASRHYDVVYESAPGRVDGWVSYRVENRWPSGLAANIIKVRMLIGLTPEAEAALWRYLLDLDLAGSVQLTSGRSTTRSAGGWPTPGGCGSPTSATSSGCGCSTCRARSPPGATRSPATLVLEVTDAQRPRNQGRFRLEGGPDGAACEPTTADPDLGLDVADLGAAYLGGASLATLSRAERVDRAHPRRPPPGRPHVRQLAASCLHHALLGRGRTIGRSTARGRWCPSASSRPRPLRRRRSGHGPGGCSTHACCCCWCWWPSAAAACWRGCWTGRWWRPGRPSSYPSPSRRCPSSCSGWC